MSEQKWPIQSDPHLAIVGTDLDRPAKTDISNFELGSVEVQVTMAAANLPHDLLLPGILASTGMPYKDIASKVYLCPATIKKHMQTLVGIAGIDGRPGLARYFFETGVFAYNGAEPINLAITPREREILEEISYGKTNAQIGAELGLSPSTVKGLSARTMERTGWRARERLALAGLAGGYIGGFALRGAEVSEPVDQVLPLWGQADEGARVGDASRDASITRAAAHLLVS